MKKVALIIVIACCLWSCKNNIIVDGNDSTHVVCVKNNQQKNISTKLIGITEDKAKEYGYSLLFYSAYPPVFSSYKKEKDHCHQVFSLSLKFPPEKNRIVLTFLLPVLLPAVRYYNTGIRFHY